MFVNRLNFGIGFSCCLLSFFMLSSSEEVWAHHHAKIVDSLHCQSSDCNDLFPEINVPGNVPKLNFTPPERRDKPEGGTISGGSRPVDNSCISSSRNDLDTQTKEAKVKLTALTPGEHNGLTTRSRPELLVYLPLTRASNIELSVFDNQGDGVYQKNFSIDKSKGFVKLPLFSGNEVSLESNKSYYWTLAIICNQSDRTEDIVVGGSIEYAPPNKYLQQRLDRVSGIEKISLLARKGYWYDALLELLEMRRENPNDKQLAQGWEQLLQSVGLKQVAKEPINESMLVTTSKH